MKSIIGIKITIEMGLRFETMSFGTPPSRMVVDCDVRLLVI